MGMHCRRHDTFSLKFLRIAAMVLALSGVCGLRAHESDTIDVRVPVNKEVLHSTLFGMGTANILDSYLSPYNYTGTDFRLQRETMRMTRLWDGRVANQALFDLNAAITENHVGNRDEYAIGLRYSQTWLYHFVGSNIVNPVERSDERFHVAAGLSASAYLGGVYIDRSGNNPGQAKANLALDLNAVAVYDFTVGRRHFLCRYQLAFPLTGAAFSPNYGQSYYEMAHLKHYDHNICFTYPGNALSMRHRLTVDIPVGRHALRLGYAAQFDQYRLNNLKYHNYTHDFMIGFTKYILRR